MSPSEITSYRPTIRDLPAGERPRERLQHFGANALSTAELLAIILQSGSREENAVRLSERLLVEFEGLAGLAQATLEELCQVPGIGMAKASQVKASLVLGRRLLRVAPPERYTVRSPADAANLLLPDMSLLEQEELRTIRWTAATRSFVPTRSSRDRSTPCRCGSPRCFGRPFGPTR